MDKKDKFNAGKMFILSGDKRVIVKDINTLFEADKSKLSQIQQELNLTLPQAENAIVRLTQLHHVDLSALDLSDSLSTFVGEIPLGFTPDVAKRAKQVRSWTDDVIWPDVDKMPTGFNPQQILENAKAPMGMSELHARGITGKNIGIAIIDQRLNTQHTEYAARIKHYQVGKGFNNTSGGDYHGSLVAGNAVGKDTGTAPKGNLYYFAANFERIKKQDGTTSDGLKYLNEMIRAMLELNKTLPEDKKIRFLSCSWGNPNQPGHDETVKLFDECERNGIMVLGGGYKRTGIYAPCDKRYKNNITNRIGIPTDGKTTPYFNGGYYYTRQGGSSSTFPYLAGVFACALQGNTIFCTRPGWQDELIDIMQRTAIDHEHGGKIINPTGIVDAVTQIAREMELNLIKQQANEHE